LSGLKSAPTLTTCHLERRESIRLRIDSRSRKACPEPAEGTPCSSIPLPAHQGILKAHLAAPPFRALCERVGTPTNPPHPPPPPSHTTSLNL
jgi:hypothetical protein